MVSVQDNQQIYERLSRLVARKFLLTDDEFKRNVDYGPLEINDFSICFEVDVIGRTGPEGIYVKIPKENLYRKGSTNILPLTDNDREFAEKEYQSLAYLAKFWRSEDTRVRFVELLGFVKEYNAIITKRVYASNLFKAFRRWDLAGRIKPNGRIDPIHRFLTRIGAALNRFHETSIEYKKFDINNTLSKISLYFLQIQSFGIDSKFVDSISSILETLNGHSATTQFSTTLKGLDIRNVLVDKEGRIFILDPGKIKKDIRETDLARFVVTCRILYWGSVFFFLRLSPKRSYEDSFLQGYYGRRERSNKILGILIIKELLKQWNMAHIALQLKRWGTPAKNIIKQTYINPFFKKQISAEFAKLEE
jgi:hypothetical protein